MREGSKEAEASTSRAAKEAGATVKQRHLLDGVPCGSELRLSGPPVKLAEGQLELVAEHAAAKGESQ